MMIEITDEEVGVEGDIQEVQGVIVIINQDEDLHHAVVLGLLAEDIVRGQELDHVRVVPDHVHGGLAHVRQTMILIKRVRIGSVQMKDRTMMKIVNQKPE